MNRTNWLSTKLSAPITYKLTTMKAFKKKTHPNPNWLLKAHVPGLLAVSGIQTLMKLEWVEKKKIFFFFIPTPRGVGMTY
jgi:hypothetical protein